MSRFLLCLCIIIGQIMHLCAQSNFKGHPLPAGKPAFQFPPIDNNPIKYVRAKVYLDGKSISELSKLGIATDHGQIKDNMFFISDLSEVEVANTQNAGFRVEILISDVSTYYKEQNMSSNKTSEEDGFICNTQLPNIVTPNGFELGNMGGYLTYVELLAHLDSMSAHFPHLITPKLIIDTNITTYNGNYLYYVKLSDNPNDNELEPQVLYTALHHAREPATITNLIFYMYYLLENYENNSEIKYLVDNTEMYFIPCVNPDGYLYNQQMEANGGGMWRKNRHPFPQNQFGVDLNRNYGFNWGYDNEGSSPNASSDTYRGTSPFSEPETQLVRNFCIAHHFELCLNYHTYGNMLIYPWGYQASFLTPDDSTFQVFAGLLTEHNHYLHGTGDQTVGYVTNGDSDDWMYGEQTEKNKILSMTPESGEGDMGFWPPANQIINIAKDNLLANFRNAHLANYYPEFHDVGASFLYQTQGAFPFSFRRVGLRQGANYIVSIEPLTDNITAVGSSVLFINPDFLLWQQDSITYMLHDSIQNGETIRYVLKVDNGLYTFTDTITKMYGQPDSLPQFTGVFSQDWISNEWAETNLDYHTTPISITSSPNGQYLPDQYSPITTRDTVNLQDAVAAYATFYAKWDIEVGYDYVQLQAKTDSTEWQPLCGAYTHLGTNQQPSDEPLYDGNQSSWIQEKVSLNDYLNKKIALRFVLVTDPGLEKKGFYFDDFEIYKLFSPIDSLPIDTIPNDTIPNDTIPNDTIPNDTIPNDTTFVKHLEYAGKILQSYPNPSDGLATIRYYLDKPRQSELFVYDNMGKVVCKMPILFGQTDKITVDIRHLPNGIYFYCLKENGVQITNWQKWIIFKE